MRILYFFYELKTPMYQWQHLHLIDELCLAGHDVKCFNPLDYESINEANEKIVKLVKNEKDWDLFLTCDDQDVIFKETVSEISKMGIPTCLICWDNIELPYKQKEIAPLFDLVWITSIETKYLFERWGCKRILFQTYAANPYVFVPKWNQPIEAVGFIGTPYGSRVNKLNDLLSAKVRCNVYSDALINKGYNSSLGTVHHYDLGDVCIKASRYLRFPIGRKVLLSTICNQFLHKHPSLNLNSDYLTVFKSVTNEEMNFLYSNLSLSLNITELRDTYILKKPIHKIHLRTFEIPMSGGLQFAFKTDELASYFEEDKEIVLYSSLEEMVSKAQFYLKESNRDTVLNMKKAARQRAEHEHTWTLRFQRVFDELGLK
jgi:hypothetical protein